MQKHLVIVFCLWSLPFFAQKKEVRLVDIQSSECGGSYYTAPHFVGKSISGDTTFLSLSCSNNCGGYHNPEVVLRDDSVNIFIHPGTVVYYADEEIISLQEVDSFRLAGSQIAEEHSYTNCDCCFTFTLKVVGLDSSVSYNYFYNGQFVDPNYKAPKPKRHLILPYIFKEKESKVIKDVRRLIRKSEGLKNMRDFALSVNLDVDTINGSVIWATSQSESDDLDFEEKVLDSINNYFKYMKPVKLFNKPDNSALMEHYWIYIAPDRITGKMKIVCISGEMF